MEHPKDEELFRRIDHTLSEETTLQEGLDRAVEMGWMSQEEADHILYQNMQKDCDGGETV